MANVEEKVESLIKPTIENLGYELYDVIYEKEAKDYYLRIFINTPKGISLEDCEKVNDAITDMLDEANYIKDAYFLEVSSPGIERVIRKNEHLEASLEKEITVNLFKPINLEENTKQNSKVKKPKTLKQIDGILKSFNENEICLIVQDEEIVIERKNISNMKIKYNW